MIPKWRLVAQHIDNHVQRKPERMKRWYEIKKRILLAHYEEMYG